MRIVHYLNQFFGGIGGEDRADVPPEVHTGAVGPGRLLEQLLQGESEVVATVVCGDNYAAERLQEVSDLVVQQVGDSGADLLLAGPCFQAGRYGTAAGAVCYAVQSRLGVAAVPGMSPDNPGADLYHEDLYILDSGASPARMREVLSVMVRLGGKLVRGEALGSPSQEGYIPRGFLRSEFVDQTAAQRLGEMLLLKLKGQPFQSEVPTSPPAAVPPAPPVADLARATVALVTDGGLVPRGNPDRLPRAFAQVWGAYSIAGMSELRGDDFEVAHGGYDNQYVQQDPNRLVPVDVLRDLEREGYIHRLHPEFLSTTGNTNPLDNSRRMGREMAQMLCISRGLTR